MPLTPFHLGPGLFLGALTLKFFNLCTILLGSIVMDIEPMVLLIVNPCLSCPHHGFFHSILGAILGSLILAVILYSQKEKLNKLSLKFKIQQSFSFPVLFFSSLLSWLIHIFFDNLTHFDVFLFWPSHFKPLFIGKEIYWPLSLICLIFGIFGFLLVYKKIKTPKNL